MGLVMGIVVVLCIKNLLPGPPTTLKELRNRTQISLFVSFFSMLLLSLRIRSLVLGTLSGILREISNLEVLGMVLALPNPI
jgi:hypothetical protein